MIGRLLGGRYEIIEAIDSGGMAYIYKALCRKTDAIVAVKILKEKFADSEEYVARFKKEAEAAFTLDHDNVVRVTDIGYDEGVYYMVMEHIDGPSLKALIENGTAMEEKTAIEYAIQICSALDTAHKKGIIHRDIKPQNILLDKDGNIKVTDFGIAKSMSAKEEGGSQVIGSVFYISPEQARGDRVDHRTDIYSLGIVLYEMLTGVLPYTGDKTVAVALKHINEQIVAPIKKNANLSASVNNIVLKATSKNKKDRYQSMSAFKEDLIRALVEPDGSFVDAPAVHVAIRRLRDQRKDKVWKICILAVLIAVLSVAIFFGADAISSSGQAISVPDLRGLAADAAAVRLSQEDLSVQIVYEPNETVEPGAVVSQEPVYGAEVAKGSTVMLYVSNGPGALTMPDVGGMTLDEAEALIEQMGLGVDDITYQPSEDVAEGDVISQYPEAGDAVVENDLVSLVVSGEEAQSSSAALPQLSGQMLDQAIGLLYEQGFKTCYVYEEESDLAEGTIIEQSPGESLQTVLTNEIDLWISQYTTKERAGTLAKIVDIPEKESKVRVVLEDIVNGHTVNFVAQEIIADAGPLSVNINMESFTSGVKTVVVYINNIAAYTYEVNFD